jgi:hypothetical protein
LEEEPGGLGGLCIAADNALLCKADCGGGRFTVRADGSSHIRIIPERTGLTLNACHEGKPRIRVDARNPLPRLRNQNYDVCGNPYSARGSLARPLRRARAGLVARASWHLTRGF